MWSLIISGFGSGLTLAPLAAVGLSSAPSTKVGIASAVISASNRLGNILGVAIQGTILTQQLASDLARSLSAWGLPSNLQDRLIADVLRGGIKVPSNLPVNISTQAMHQAISNAFVSGLHATVLVASVSLLGGAFLILVFVQPTFNQVTNNSPLSIKQKKKGRINF